MSIVAYFLLLTKGCCTVRCTTLTPIPSLRVILLIAKPVSIGCDLQPSLCCFLPTFPKQTEPYSDK